MEHRVVSLRSEKGGKKVPGKNPYNNASWKWEIETPG
jgi:hypothetical protein